MLTTRTIFLAEDDIDDQEFLAEALLAIDPKVNLISFSSGLKFIEHLDNTPQEAFPSLILLDYNIPEMNGAEILAYLNKNNRYTEINKVIWSTSDSKLYQQNCLALGAKAYLIKPSSVSGMNEMARQILEYCINI